MCAQNKGLSRDMQKPHLFREGKERDAFPQQLLRKYLHREITARGRLRLGRAPERFAGGTCPLGPDPPPAQPHTTCAGISCSLQPPKTLPRTPPTGSVTPALNINPAPRLCPTQQPGAEPPRLPQPTRPRSAPAPSR